MQVTVLGTGIMGAAITRTLIRAGHSVTVWNRTPARAEALRDGSATVAASARDAVNGAEVVLLTLFDAAAVLEVMADAVPAASDAVWVQASTIGIDATERAREVAEGAGAALLEAMMLGTKAPAEQGQLTLLVSGPEELDARVGPVFDAIAAKIIRVGPRVGQASGSSSPPTRGSGRSRRQRHSLWHWPAASTWTRSCSSTRSPTRRSTVATRT